MFAVRTDVAHRHNCIVGLEFIKVSSSRVWRAGYVDSAFTVEALGDATNKADMHWFKPRAIKDITVV